MQEALKDKLDEILVDKNITKEELKKFQIQEIIFLMFKAQVCKNEEAFKGVDFKEKIKLYIEIITEKIIESNELYIAYNKVTGYPHTDYEKRAWIFSEKEYGVFAKKHFEETGLILDIKLLNNDEVIKSFSEFYRLGIEGVVIDNGQYTINLEREKVIPPMDYTGFSEKDIPTTNPKLFYSMMRFKQEIDNKKNNYEGKNKVVSYLEREMIKEILRGKYLIPVIKKEELKVEGRVFVKKNNDIHYGILTDNKGKEFQPLFTDWIEFKKNYDTSVWEGKKCSYREVISFMSTKKNIVINPFGLKIQIDSENKKKIESFERSLVKKDKEKNISMKIGEPLESPIEMIDELVGYMKTVKGIKRAYLRYVTMGREENYLIIVDIEKNKDNVFREIEDIYKKYIKDISLEITEKISFRESLDKITPFYKKKKFGIF
ncbi:MAG: enhanced serine sensitivity protein SseB C-terminal domain-containing protein [Clostridium sp.]|uniref:enhanced serine sensitivity protein SseB C-terminal domain-containing protein n=1 Tax=Clostridium sp. TaxID=1506 RepID=UPI003EE7BAD7